eukprot:CAMPEP_0201895106 /NCGR_PEP_ID=MMETSP0902-20130614/42042_1 /ASSEMBLY_ACC=CAM_ASM_000551 /TAXON_ID=420261 /ORGANISM="Thalassiosira antarctica, Strain CCMP982" /LENGTH=328 /DNA_ID=CAMNT_0048427343 /DNA_START=1 /DNA_END=987 /DNA_ORIENTATION=-
MSLRPPVTIALVLLVLIYTNYVVLRFAHNQGSSSWQEAASNAPPLTRRSTRRIADGCYHVFIDVGANIGVHTRFLYEPQKYPDSKSAVSHFVKHFGPERDNRDYCSFAFEPNPIHKERHLELQTAYKRMGWHYHPIFAGAGDEEGNMTFYHMHDQSNMEFGFNSLRTWNARGMEGEAEVVPIIRLATFLLDQIRDRSLPEIVYGASTIGPKVVLKMDVEGMEYVILPDLVTSGALCQTVDFCFGEFHPQQFFFPINRKETHGGLFLANAEEGKAFGASLIRALQSSQNCKTIYSMADDEKYLKDQEIDGSAIPFPEPSNNELFDGHKI